MRLGNLWVRRTPLALAAALVLGAGGAGSAETAPPLELTVVSYNVAGVPIAHPEVSARLAAIGRWLEGLRPDIVCLQEVWRARDALDLQAAGRRAGLHYSARFLGGRGRSGLLTLSRFEVVRERFHAFSRNGSFDGLLRGAVDVFSRKGVGTAILQTPGGRVTVLNTHLIAADRSGGRDRVYGTRYKQILEVLGELASVDPAAPTLLLGDLNATPKEGMVRLLRGRGHLLDAVKAGLSHQPRRRIDHVLVRPAPGGRVEVRGAAQTLTRPRLLATGGVRRLSDHPAIVARLRLYAHAAPAHPH